jgi:hypothetical protein
MDNAMNNAMDNAGRSEGNTKSAHGHGPWTPEGGPHHGHSGGGLVPRSPEGESAGRAAKDADHTADRLLDLLEVALDDERIHLPPRALVRLCHRFVELAHLNGLRVVRQPTEDPR